jgi:hypothetical protein
MDFFAHDLDGSALFNAGFGIHSFLEFLFIIQHAGTI